MLRTFSIFFVTILTFMTLSCDSSKYSSSSKEINNINERISKLENENMELNTSINDLKKGLTYVATEMLHIKVDNISKTIATFTPNSQGFQSIDTNTGFLFISLENIEKYANGYKITFNIRNLYYIIYSNLHLVIEYGPNNKNKSGIDTSSWKRFETTITQDLLPPYWNTVSVVLSPAKEKDIENIWVQAKSEMVKLNKETIEKITPFDYPGINED